MTPVQKMVISLMIEGISIKQISQKTKIPEGMLRQEVMFPGEPFPADYLHRLMDFYFFNTCNGVH